MNWRSILQTALSFIGNLLLVVGAAFLAMMAAMIIISTVFFIKGMILTAGFGALAFSFIVLMGLTITLTMMERGESYEIRKSA